MAADRLSKQKPRPPFRGACICVQEPRRVRPRPVFPKFGARTEAVSARVGPCHSARGQRGVTHTAIRLGMHDVPGMAEWAEESNTPWDESSLSGVFQVSIGDNYAYESTSSIKTMLSAAWSRPYDAALWLERSGPGYNSFYHTVRFTLTCSGNMD